jgi:hypothetical protein
MTHDNDTIFNVLSKHDSNKFDDNTRILIFHDDTDYYMPHVKYGLKIFNLYQVCCELNIALNSIIFVTNHAGIGAEFRLLLGDDARLPMVIDNVVTFNNDISIPIENFNLHIDTSEINIKYNMLCMMGKKRVHRYALYNFILQNNLSSKIHTTFHGDYQNED